MTIKSKTLSTPAATLLETLHTSNAECFSMEEAYRLMPQSNQEAVRQLLAGMVKRGLLMRVKEGVYWVVPFDQPAEGFFPNWHWLAHHLAGKTHYYIGYASALQLLSLNVQPVLEEQVVVNRQIKPAILPVKGIPFRFISHNDAHFFGFQKTWVDDHRRVYCSDLEKTLIDCLFKPSYSGGIPEILRAMHKSKDLLDLERLLEYAARFNSQSVVKRLGFLLELLRMGEPILGRLHQMRTKSLTPLDPGLPKSGKISSRWMVLQNIETTSLLSPIFT